MSEIHLHATIHFSSDQWDQLMTGISDLNAATAALATAVTNNTAAVDAAVAALGSGDSDTAVEAAAQQVEAANAALESNTAKLTAAVPAPPALVPSSAAVSIPVGSTTAVPLSFTGGTGAITASGLPTGVTWDGSANLVPDGTQVAGDSSVTFSDSSSPALTASVALAVA